MKLVPVGAARRFLLQYLECGASQYGGMLAYSLFVSLIPLALGVLSLFGLGARGPRRNALIRQLLVEIFPPDLHSPVREALTAAGQHAGTIFLVSLIGLAWFSTGLYSTAGFALNQIFGWPNRSFWEQRLRGLWLVGALILAVSVAVGFDVLVRLVAMPGWVALIGTWIALSYLIAFLYRHAPSHRIRRSEVWPGAAGAALVIVVAGFLLTVTTTLTVQLGADTRFFAEVFALAAWVYFIAQAILFGAFFNRFLIDARLFRTRRLEESKAQVGQLARLRDADRLELDQRSGGMAEEANAAAEQHGHDMDKELV